VLEVGRRITFITQDAQEGFGHAVLAGRAWVGDAPFLLMLGDHLYASETEASCAAQVVGVYERVGQSVLGLKVTPESAVANFGTATGVWVEADSLLRVTEVCEKPSVEYAREHLSVEGMPEGHFLTVFGQYVLEPRVFDYLAELVSNNIRERGEFQLTSCLDRLRREEGMSGYVVRGERFDIGTPGSYREAVLRYGAERQ
jgi:UTP--glucose-1-phosphate uridylyltransferase